MTFHLKADTDLSQPELDALRTQGQDLANAEDWHGLLALRPELEADAEFWPDFWGPACALAARKLGRPGAIELLAELVRVGFTQPELFAGELERAFADDPGWPLIEARMAAGNATAPMVLTEWPALTPSAPLCLLEVPGRADELRAQLPAARPSAWDTAVATLAWVTGRWEHANAHLEIDDAVECLRRVDQGQRFACVEYSLVLTQSLNALAIPARRVSLRQQNYFAGIGRGHVVSEAWIDDLGRWVLLDGQNGLYWTGASGEPLGPLELQQAFAARDRRPNFVTVGAPMDEDDADLWFTYFAHATSNAGTWSPGSFGLVFQRTMLHMSRRLEHRPEVLYPDLSELGVETALDGHQPAVRLLAAHPFARGFATDGADLAGDILRLDDRPGEHATSLAVRTDYGLLPGTTLRYTVA
ncbi:MAG: transglutaminase domain-containing protein [Streptosporangiaceae bacterium]